MKVAVLKIMRIANRHENLDVIVIYSSIDKAVNGLSENLMNPRNKIVKIDENQYYGEGKDLSNQKVLVSITLQDVL
jgi:hypothetical protein